MTEHSPENTFTPLLPDIRIIDCTNRLPGPLCTKILADLGAEVLKLEAPGEGDPFRAAGPIVEGESLFFRLLNRGKSSMTLNLKDSRGQAISQRLLAGADVLVESFGAGAGAYGLDRNSVLRINAGIVHCTLSGYGLMSSRSAEKAHDLNLIARSGLLDLLRGPGSCTIPPLRFSGVAGAVAAALSIAAALVRRIKTGNGAFIDASLLDALDPFLCLAAERQFIEATTAQLAEDIGGGGFACYNVYETNDGKQLAVAAVEEKFWRQFVNLLGKDHLAGDHLNPKGQQPLIQEIAATIKTRSQAEWLKLFEDRNICVTEVNSPLEAFADPPAGGRPSRRGASGFPFAVDGRRPDFRKPTPGLGEQTEAILDALDISRDEQEILRREGVI